MIRRSLIALSGDAGSEPIAIAPAIRAEIRDQLARAIADGAVRCRHCGTVFRQATEYKHDLQGRVVCRGGCGGAR